MIFTIFCQLTLTITLIIMLLTDTIRPKHIPGIGLLIAYTKDIRPLTLGLLFCNSYFITKFKNRTIQLIK